MASHQTLILIWYHPKEKTGRIYKLTELGKKVKENL
jgi:hypothetical protein